MTGHGRAAWKTATPVSISQREIKDNMENTPPAPIVESAGPVIDLSADVQAELARIDAAVVPDYDLRVTIARLTVAARRRSRPRSLTAQANAEQRAERRYRGWRTEIDKMAEKAWRA